MTRQGCSNACSSRSRKVDDLPMHCLSESCRQISILYVHAAILLKSTILSYQAGATSKSNCELAQHAKLNNKFSTRMVSNMNTSKETLVCDESWLHCKNRGRNHIDGHQPFNTKSSETLTSPPQRCKTLTTRTRRDAVHSVASTGRLPITNGNGDEFGLRIVSTYDGMQALQFSRPMLNLRVCQIDSLVANHVRSAAAPPSTQSTM